MEGRRVGFCLQRVVALDISLSDHALAQILRELRVLHDGAPNVGTAWVQDAFSQAELVLHSLKLATEMLAPGGIFITKVFRSKDYNSLLYIFNQLFKKVESTKPPSSRNVSAEIFVVCQDFLAPKKIDPRLLDPAHVFKDLDVVRAVAEGDSEPSNNKLTPNAQNVFKPEKKHRARDGYEDGDYTLHKAVPAVSLIKASDPIKILGVANVITFGTTAEDKAILSMKCTSKEIRTDLQDLKVLGKGDFKKILKWRTLVREIMGLETKEDPDADVSKDAVQVEPMTEEGEMEAEVRKPPRGDGLFFGEIDIFDFHLGSCSFSAYNRRTPCSENGNGGDSTKREREIYSECSCK